MSAGLTVLAVFLSVGIGACFQRIAGMGVGLLAGPVLSLILGPVEGILVVNVLAATNALITSVNMRADIDWRKFFLIAPALIFGAVPGALLIRAVEPDVVLVLVGALLLLALALVTFGKRFVPEPHGPVPAVTSGVIGGFMNTLAGIAGPAITVYAQAARWEQRVYAATLQPIFFVSGIISFTIKEFSGAADLTGVNAWIWGAGALGMVLGIVTGVKLVPRISRSTAHRIALLLAALGGATALVRGAAGLFG